MFSTLRAGYNSLQASTQPQSATSTIDKLCERLLNSQQREDRRAALLALKGLSRDWKSVRPSPVVGPADAPARRGGATLRRVRCPRQPRSHHVQGVQVEICYKDTS